jgi:signal transduction histidine kinase
MWTLLILAIIAFAIMQRRRLGGMCGFSHRFERALGSGSEHEPRGCAGWDMGEPQTRFERKFKRKMDRAARDFERQAERIRERAGAPPERSPQFKTEEERRAYERARKRAAAEAGFYVHLMWYGIVIGFLFILNRLTTGFQWWLFPAFFWGFGLMSHFGAVYGWRWIHERVFEPAIQREVEREVSRERDVLRNEKQASLDELTASFAHEIRNPIAAAKSLVQQMGEDPTSQENVEYARVALDELARVERSVSHLLKYAKEEDYRFDNVNLASVLDGALTQMKSKLEAEHVSVSRSYISGPAVRADAEKLRQVFTNIIDNAIDAMASKDGERRLQLSISLAGNVAAVASIRDNGCGIPEDRLARIFNPFYTTKTNGTGLGMGVAKKIVEAHRGRIQVTSAVGKGTEFSVSVPLADAALRGVAGGSASEAAHGNGRTPEAPAAAAFGGLASRARE